MERETNMNNILNYSDVFTFDIKQLFFDIFESKNMEKFSFLTEENCDWFLSNFSSNQELKNPIIEIFNNARNDYNYNVESFVDHLIYIISQLSNQITEKLKNLSEIENEIISLNEIHKKFENSPTNLNDFSLENQIYISYVKENNELLKKYRIKYKTSFSTNDFQSIYSESDTKKCVLNYFFETKFLFINVLGKKTNDSQNDFTRIGQIQLPNIEIFSAIKSKFYEFKILPAIYLILNFDNELEENKETHHFELRFDLKLNRETRLKIIDELLIYYEKNKDDIQHSLIKREKLMNDIIKSFENWIGYSRKKGVYAKKNEIKRSCDVHNCTLI